MKKIYLLDTSIVSEFTKVNPNETVASLYKEKIFVPFQQHAGRN